MITRNLNFIIGIVFIAIISCKKETLPKPEVVQQTIAVPMEKPVGVIYVVDDAILYQKNLSTGELKYFNHFGTNRAISIFDPYAGVVLPFDTIIKDGTTWFFNNSGQFILNGKTTYSYQTLNQTIRVYGLENGSARPITILKSGKEFLSAEVYKSYVTINNTDYEFYTELYLKKQGYNGAFATEPIKTGAVYGGVLSGAQYTNNYLTGTKWIITKYISSLNTVTPNDTLEFISYNKYRLNGSAERNYTLSYISGTGLKSLTLYYCMTLGGTYAGEVLDTFDKDGVINDAKFTNLNTNQTTRVWMKKL